ncbi:hypothetical protein [Schlesneria sp. DSM 10557]|uniref:hypothetical protein n=1 Tax=Schlesneria sp. DSM 10557 TaxID=3044399 RepID=UPI00359F2F2A
MSTLHTAERTNPEQGDSRVPEELASLIKRHRIRPLERDGRTLLSVDAEWFWSDPNSTTLNQRGQ